MDEKPGKILVIQLRRIGDVILATPAVRALRRQFPDAKIDFLAEPACGAILAGNPRINEVLSYDPAHAAAWLWKIRRRGYDWVIDFLGNPRTCTICAFSGAKLRAGPGDVYWKFGYNHVFATFREPGYAALEKMLRLRELGVEINGSDHLPEIFPSEADRRWADEELSKAGLSPNGRPLLMLAPASRKITRQYPEEHFVRAVQLINETLPCRIAVLWGPGEEGLAANIAARCGGVKAPHTDTLGRAAALVGKCDLLLTNCNGPKHMAVAQGRPTLTIHSSSDPRAWTPPDNPLHRYVRREDLDCVPCYRNECTRGLECLNGLPPERVAETALQMLKYYKKV